MPGKRKSRRDRKKFAKLQSLQCFPDVYKLLCDGYPVSQVASYIQNEHGEYTGIQQKTLQHMLTDFKREMIPDDHKVTFPEASKVRDRQEAAKGVDLVEEMKALYYVQLSRVQIATRVEEENGHLIEGAGREVKVASDLLMRLSKLIDRAEEKNEDGPYKDLEDGARASMAAEEATGIDAAFLQDPMKRQQFLELFQKLQSAETEVVLDLSDDEPEELPEPVEAVS